MCNWLFTGIWAQRDKRVAGTVTGNRLPESMSYREVSRVGIIWLSAMALAGAAAAQTPSLVRIRGDIVSRTGDTLTIHRRSGDAVTVACSADVLVSSVRRVQLSDIKAGSFVGTAASADANGNLIALEVVVFQKSARGTGEGHYMWDLGPQSSMINANVDAVVGSGSGSNLRLSHSGGGIDTVTVPPSLPIVTFVPASAADLIAGKRVLAVVAMDSPNHYVAQRIVVEKDGVVPLM
jgi:hypothetical protein